MIDPAAYARLESAAAAAFSHDGRRLFHLRGAGLQQIWELELDSGKARQLTFHDERVSVLRRAPGDDRVAYLIDAGGDERHQVWLLDGGASRALTTDPGVVHGLGAWSPDGARLSITANDRDEAHFDVLMLDVATGERARLFEGTHEATVGAWAADGRMVAVLDRRTGDQRPVIVSEASAEPLPRTTAARYSSLRWDGGALLGLCDAGREFVALCRVGLDGGITVEYAPEARDVEAWTLSGGGVLATVENDRGYSVLRVGPRFAEREVVALPPGVVADLAWSADGRLAFAFSAPTRPGGLWVWEEWSGAAGLGAGL